MSNTRKLRDPLLKKPTLYQCAVCRKKFATPADRNAHWKFIPGGRMCTDEITMRDRFGFRYRRGAWYRPTGHPSPASL